MTTDHPSGILSAIGNTPLIPLTRLFPRADVRLYGKLEAVNPGGSIKDRTALTIISRAVAGGDIPPDATIIESSSGNMAIGLAQACRYFGLRLIVVVDPKINRATLQILRAYGAEIECVREPDPIEGYLGARLQRVQALLESVPNSFWSRQYTNPLNPAAHYETMREIIRDMDGDLDYLFAATSTCGTLMGCARFARDQGLATRLVAVDAVGSVLFGTEAAERLIPGHGAGRPSPLLDRELVDDVVHVTDWECVWGCRRLLDREAILAGGSTGAVVAAVGRLLPSLPAGASAAIIICDRGERYLETIYSDEWVARHLVRAPHGTPVAP